MANNAVKTPLFRAISSRNYCCAGGSQGLNPIGGTLNNIKTCTLQNKLVVASAETGSPLTRLSFIFKAGSRYESHDNKGATHALRLATGLATKNCSSFAIIRNLQQVGANLTCTTDREIIAYTLTGTYDAVKFGSKYLSEIATAQVFKPWEVKEIAPRLKLELACITPEVRVMELLHSAAYRTGLGNSLFCPKHQASKMSPETLQHYVAQMMTASRGAVVGVGVNSDELENYAQNCGIQTGEASPPTTSTYYGGSEARRELGGDLAYVALATEGGNMNEAVVYEVLKHILGTGPRVQWGNEVSSILSRVATKVTSGDHPTAMSAFNNSYADSGLFGIMLISGASTSADLVCAAARTLRSISINDKDLARAKQQTKLDGLLKLECGDSCIAQISRQALLGECPLTPQDYMAAVDKVTLDDVKKVADKISKGKLTMAAVGNLSGVPYLDQLK